jgi:hypothetical protein
MRNNKNEFNLWGDWNVCTFELLWLFFGKEVVFSKTYPSFLTLKEGSTSHLGLLSSGEKKETALRCSEPLRYKVGGPSKVFASFCGMGPPGVGSLQLPILIKSTLI